MKPFVLYGHDRPLTWVQYSREGDLLFTCAKDHFPMVWYAETGERLGIYVGHTGSVWHLDVDFHCRLMLTGAADNSTKLWDVQTGNFVQTLNAHENRVSCLGVNKDGTALCTGSWSFKLKVFFLSW